MRWTVVGYGLVAGALAGAWWLASPALGVLDPRSLALVLVVAAGYLLICHPATELQVLGRPLPVADEATVAARLVALAGRHRQHGVRGLEQELRAATDPLEVQGLRLLTGGATAPELEAALRRTAAGLAEAELEPARVWESLGRGAVNGGVLVSLVQMATAVGHDPSTADKALAAAIAATVYGFVMGWFLGHPLALGWRRAAARAGRVRELWIEGLVAIAAGVHPLRLADRLAAPGTRQFRAA